MMSGLLRRLSTRENSILFLTLTALACLPISLGKLIQDSATSLLLPVTVLSTLIAFGFASFSKRKVWAELLLLICAPILLFIRVANIGSTLLSATLESLHIAIQVILTAQGYTRSTIDFNHWISAGDLLANQTKGFANRLVIWVTYTIQNKYIGDPAARAYICSLGLCLIAAWAGWQVRRQRKILAGLFPAMTAFALIINNTTQWSGILWLFLSAFILLLGVTHYQKLVTSWKRQGTDFSDSIWEDSLIATLSMGLVLVSTAYMVSSFSFKAMVDQIRGQPGISSNSSSVSTSAVETTAQAIDSLPESHMIQAGPSLSSDVVMLISTGDFPPMPYAVSIDVPRYYWRTMTYETYTGSGWTNQPSTNEDVPPNQMLIKDTPANYRIVHQSISFPGTNNESLFWTGTLLQSSSPMQIAWRTRPVTKPPSEEIDPFSGGDMVGGMIRAQNSGNSTNYTIESFLPNVKEIDLQAAPGNYPDWVRQRYLTLPDTVPERVRALARDITANAETPFDRALAIETYLRKYPYSLAVPAPPADHDATDYFLFDLKKGYCDYYATAMTVLARAADLPARLVIGYANGEYDPYTAQYVIRQSDAHAWTEIYFSGIGWIEFEPTANQPTPKRNVDQHPTQRPPTDLQNPFTLGKIPTFLTGRFNFSWQLIVGLILLYIAWVGSQDLLMSLQAPSKTIQQIFQRLRRQALSITGFPSPDITIREYTANLNRCLDSMQNHNPLNKWLLSSVHERVNSISEFYTQSLFSPTPLDHVDTRSAIKNWGHLRWRLFLIKIILLLKPVPLNQ